MEEQTSEENAGTTLIDVEVETKSSGPAPPPIPVREHLITTAVRFLANPNVQRSSINAKQKFLRSKGLTEDEIQVACDRAGVFTTDPNAKNQTIISMGVGTTTFPLSNSIIPQQTMFGKVRELLNSVAIISGVFYGLYLLYKKFIEPLIFRVKKKKTIEEQISDVNKNVDEKIRNVQEELVKINEELTKSVQTTNFSKELISLKTDLDTIRGLLLNKKQFAARDTISGVPVVPPSIPAWQLSSVPPQQHLEHLTEEESEIHDKNDETGSGGSSEGEVVTKNSDSSLEIIS